MGGAGETRGRGVAGRRGRRGGGGGTWFVVPTARFSPLGPHAPQLTSPLSFPEKCLRLMNVSLLARSQTAKLPSTSPSTSFPADDHVANETSKWVLRASTFDLSI